MHNFPTFHSHPQSLDTASTPEAFIKRELELGTGAVTVTDHGTLTACRKVYDLGKKAGLIPILGLEGYFRDDDCPILKSQGYKPERPLLYAPDGSVIGEDATKPAKFTNYWKYAHLTVHALDQAAYETVIRVLSAADERAERHGQERKPLFGWAQIEEMGAQNLTLGSGCLIGMVQRHLLDRDNPKGAIAYYERLRSMVKPGNFYVEVFPHTCDRNWVEGVFLTFEDGTQIKYYAGKKLRTNVGDIEAGNLAQEFIKKDSPHKELIAVKDYQTWKPYDAPKKLVKVEHIAEFLQNECRPWCPDGDVQKGCNEFMLYLANRYGDKVVISDDSHFAYPEDKVVQDTRLGGSGAWKFYGSYHRQTSEEAYGYFRGNIGTEQKEFESWIDNAREWADRFKGFKLEYKASLPTKFYPEDTFTHTMSLIKKHGRMQWKDLKYVERLDQEIKLLHMNGILDLLPYFMVSEEISALYAQNGLLTGPGRGSAAGLLLAYLLGITHVDPLEFNLSLERFITLDRIKSGKLPDIDEDFPSRDLLVHPDDPDKGWLRERFGDHVAQISVDTTLKLKSAVKDAVRATMGFIPPEVEKLAHKFEQAPQGVSEHNFVFGYDTPEGYIPGSLTSDKALQDFVKAYPSQWEIVQKMLGLPRQKGRHACAYCITNRPVHEFIPMTRVSDIPVTQYTAESVEAVGGVKMDFLVINTLKDISECIKMVQERSGVEIPESMVINGKKVPKIRLIPHNGQWFDVYRLWVSPWVDPVFRDVSEGKTETVFQFNTPGAVQYLTQNFNDVRPDGKKAIASIDDMSAFTALDRPGPLDVKRQTPDGRTVNMLEEYARRARSLPPAEPEAVFMELLPETHGIMVYQEQLQSVYQYLTSCTGAEAEDFRSNIAKKKMEKVQKAFPFFIERASAKVGKEKAEELWELFKTWGQYGFNKSHSVCYSIIGFVCAYLKHHFPLEWWTAVLRNADKAEINEKFWKYCGDLIDMPDVSLSGDTFEIRGTRIRAPISLLHGVGEGAHAELCAGRPYQDIDDFCQKIQARKTSRAKVDQITGKKRAGTSALNRGVVYTLIISGVMESLFPKTKELSDGTKVEAGVIDWLEMYEKALAKASGKKKVQQVDTKFANLSPLARFQMKKAVLPAYSDDLFQMVVKKGVKGLRIRGDERPEFDDGNSRHEPWSFVTAEQIGQLTNQQPYVEMKYFVAVPAYVEGARRFSYGGGKEACEFILDMSGTKFKFVKWGDRQSGKLVKRFSSEVVGAVVIVLLSKYKENKPFSVEDLVIVQAPLDQVETSEKSEKENANKDA